MQAKRNSVIFFISAIFLLSGCASSTKYIDPSKAEGSREWGPVEAKATVNKMVGSLYDHLKQSQESAWLSVDPIRNRTSEHIDTRMLADEISTNLVKKKIRFINREQRETAMKEMELGQTGLVDEGSAISAGNLKSPNFILSGDVTDNVRSVDGNRVQYIVVTLKLTRLETTEVVWQEQKEFLKSSKEEKYSW